MRIFKSLFIVGSLLMFTGVISSCEEEEIIVQTDGDPIQDVPPIEEEVPSDKDGDD